MICGSGGSKSRLAKAAGAETSGQMRDEKLHAVVANHNSKSKCAKHVSFGALLGIERSKKCTPLWREAHFEVKMRKTQQVQNTFGLWCRKSAGRCGAKHIPSQNIQTTPCSEHFGSWDVEKVHAVVGRSTFPSQNVQNTPCLDHFWTFRCRFAWQAQGIVHLVKSQQKCEGFVAVSKALAGVRHLKGICKDAFP